MSRTFWRCACFGLVLTTAGVSAIAHDGHDHGKSTLPSQTPAARPTRPFYSSTNDRPLRDQRYDQFGRYDQPVRSRLDTFDDFRYGDDEAGYGSYRGFNARRGDSYRYQPHESGQSCACECAAGRQRLAPIQAFPGREYEGQQFEPIPPANYGNPPPLPGENRYDDRFVPFDNSRQPNVPQLPDLGAGRHSSPRREIASQPVIPAKMKGIAKLSLADQRVALKQRTCPVTRDLLGSMGKPYKVTVLGRTVFVCCEGCVDGIRENPRKYLSDSAQ